MSPEAALADRQVAEIRKQITAEEAKGRAATDAIADLTKQAEERSKAGEDALNLLDEFDPKFREHDEIKGEAANVVADLRGKLDRTLQRMASERGTQPGVSDSGRPLNRSERRAFATIAQRYLTSDAYKRIRESGVLATQGTRINHDPVEVLERGGVDENGVLRSELIDGLRNRTTVNVGDAGAVVPIDQQVWPPVQIPVRQIQLLDLLSVVTTDSDMVNFVQQTVRADYAAETPYGTAAPEADYEFALKQASVKRIPTFIPATKDVLADQGQLQGLLQDQLMMGVRLRLEAQALAGLGSSFTDTNFQGMLHAASINSVTYQSAGFTTEYQLDAYHRAITAIRLSLYADPTAIVVHPSDYEWAVLKKDSYGRYLFSPNTESDVQSLWGLDTVISPVITQGTALVGDFKQAARLWIRTGLSVTASTEHLDFFTRGMVAILAEMRAAFATIQPRALCTVNSLTGP
jgi:HK97 family phage major capsid protein